MIKKFFIFAMLIASVLVSGAHAQTLDSSTHRIEWKVMNRFRLFRDPAFFTFQENAWRQYLIHVDERKMAPDERDSFVAQTSVLGSEHVLNDRRIAFSNVLRQNFDWRGWAAKADGQLCYDQEKRNHGGCGGIDSYLNPDGHAVELWLSAINGPALAPGSQCEWRINGQLVATADCGARVSGATVVLPYPAGGEIAVNVTGESPLITDARVRDILIAGMGDSFASGEGNPNLPVQFGDSRRYRNLYPLRKRNDAGGSATWTDELCHRSLYGQQLRAALQLAIENPKTVITFLDYTCSGAGVDAGLLGPQEYVERSEQTTRPPSGGSKDSQLYRILRELCIEKPEASDGYLTCPGGKFRRKLDFLFLSVGGNDIGFSNIVAWATLRDGASAAIANFFGATVSAKEFSRRMRDVLPDAYARLSKALEVALPLYSADDGIFDPARVVLTAYPDLVTNGRGEICEAPQSDSDIEDSFPANQSLDMFSSWLTARGSRLVAVRAQFSVLYKHMRDLSGDHGWTFAGHVYADGMFEGHGFSAQDEKRTDDPAEVLMIPCWGKADRDTQTCQQSWSGKSADWRPYNPATQNFPYALRQRWVRSFNDAYLVVNQKVISRAGKIDEQGSAAVFSETTGALHPTAEGHAAMADGLLLSVRPMLHQMLGEE